jgi:TatD DNase family protein
MVVEAGNGGVGGVLHCFTGPIELAEAGLEVGWYVSFSGIVTFRKWTDLDLLRVVPDDRLLVESDAPYLAPVPNRGRRNEPAWVPRTIELLAAARGASSDHVAACTMANAVHLFRIPMAGTAVQ